MSDNKVHYRQTTPEHFFAVPENPGDTRADGRKFRSIAELREHLAKPIRASELGGSPRVSRLRKKLGARAAGQTAFGEMLAAQKKPQSLREKLLGEASTKPATFRGMLERHRTEKDQK